jgi:RecB family exonuclease
VSESSLVTAPRARDRQALAAGWVAEHALDAPVLVIAPSLEAGSRVLRRAAEGRPAAFGWQRATVGELAARLAATRLAALGRVPVASVVLEAVCARTVHELREEGALGRYAAVGERPGLPRALARTFGELALANVAPSHPALPPDLARLYAAYQRALADAGLADRALVLSAAAERVRDPAPHPLLDVPLVLLDVVVPSALDAALIAALARRVRVRAPVRAVVPSGDGAAVRRLVRALETEAVAHGEHASTSALDRLGAQLFARVVHGAPIDASVELFSAPGESRECIEIARRVLHAAGEGVPFDRMAVLTHAPDRYRAHLVEALRRAGIPAHFSRGTVRPDPAGRALLALLACKEERLGARAFAEYLSLGVVPDAGSDGAPPAATGDVPWLAPHVELSALPLDALASDDAVPLADPALDVDPDAPVVAGSLRAPWRWEKLIVDAAVIGGTARWKRRLEGLAQALDTRLADLEDPDDPAALRLARRKEDLAHLRDFALPLLDALDALPLRATWGEWAAQLALLAERAIREPARVLAVLRELAPMGPIGPVGITEVRVVLARRLSEMVSAPSGSPAGKLYVASIEEARGLSFDVVFVPGLAEKVFPKKVVEDPIALDAVRVKLGDLATTESRVEQERLALRLAIGAAERRVVLSYPRLDTERGRPRVPSFYGLEVLRAIEGELPSFEELASRAEEAGAARMAWPAPERPEDAIDGAEYDLAVLHDVLHREGADVRGAARYLMSANPHLARTLRARFARWSEKWTRADGLVHPSDAAKTILAAHRPDARAYSATALEQLAACPYRFYLRAIVRLEPREVPEALEELDPRERGSLVHAVQAEVLGALRARGLLPVVPATLDAARAILADVVRDVAARFAERLAPAIERVWNDAIDEVHRDATEWLVRMSDAPEWVPVAFELAFGVTIEDGHDPASRGEPVRLSEGLTLRGAIDLVEQRGDALRATDHKTGATPVSVGVLGGGRVLQPALYARVLEELYPGREVIGGRLHYCTSRARFAERSVPLNGPTRAGVELVARTLGHHLERAFLPVAPAEGECARCDYRPVCGPAEERRSQRKDVRMLGPLRNLRKHP